MAASGSQSLCPVCDHLSLVLASPLPGGCPSEWAVTGHLVLSEATVTPLWCQVGPCLGLRPPGRTPVSAQTQCEWGAFLPPHDSGLFEADQPSVSVTPACHRGGEGVEEQGYGAWSLDQPLTQLRAGHLLFLHGNLDNAVTSSTGHLFTDGPGWPSGTGGLLL